MSLRSGERGVVPSRNRERKLSNLPRSVLNACNCSNCLRSPAYATCLRIIANCQARARRSCHSTSIELVDQDHVGCVLRCVLIPERGF